jgi:hypothetical protein
MTILRQRGFLDALRGAAGQGEASVAHLAYLEDRVRVNAGQPQLYGTQFTVTDGQFGPRPIESPQRLDERRAAAGLGLPGGQSRPRSSDTRNGRTSPSA